MSDSTMLLRDVITIPDAVREGDLVFKLTDAAEHTQRTLDQYVVTPQLLGAFVDAAKLVGAAVDEHRSKAAYLSGSFGSGKSNFMGVFQLLLDGNPAALAKPELAPVVAEMSKWRGERKFLTVPFHLIGAKSLESAVLGGYVEHLRKVHPDAPMPDVFADEPILDNADSLRRDFGDEAFFAKLNEGADSDDGWGDLSSWDAQRYDTARNQAADSSERRLLVQTLLTTLLSAFAEGAKANREGYVDFETGLAAMSRHAHSLGYSGLILFLDELILWLMSRMGDPSFVAEESSKISKLIEASDEARPAPIISIIARQRDLRELVGTDVPGAERLGFIDQLNFQSGRFSDIKLDDSNLPLVAHHRLLQPVDNDAAAALEESFRKLNLSDDQLDALRGVTGTDEDFRLTYPFSPAFLTVVVDVAGALQRTRTGLRVLLDLLVRNRDEFRIGQLVPVGDLYDVLAETNDPLSDAMKQQFDSAKRVYRNSLRPMLLAEHGLVEESEPTVAFRNDDRLIKTLLLAALVPNSEPFKDLTARKLVALNHGLITSPVPGSEVGLVVGKLRNWMAHSGELQVGDDPHNPTVNLVLSEVDTKAILAAVSGVDNQGARRNLIREMIAEELGVATDELMQSTSLVWRGIQRDVDLVFGNIRDTDQLTDSVFESDRGRWKVIVDFPFDEEGYTPLDDLQRIQGLRERNTTSHALCWLPAFFTAGLRRQLGDLVRLNYLLPVPGQTSDRFRDATKNLSAEARAAARPQLEAQQSAARGRVQAALRQAYGIGNADPAVVDTSHGLADHFPSLLGGFKVTPPVASGMRDAFDKVITEALAHTYPAAPQIDHTVRTADLRTVADIATQALEEPDHRIAHVPAADRKLMARIANPLRLGVQSDQAFVLDVSTSWGPHFTRQIAEREQSGEGGNPTVGELRSWIDVPKAMGLSRELANLVIIVWAAATDRTFRDHGGPATVRVDALPDHLEVIAQDLPDIATWSTAVDRATRVLGVAGLPVEPSAVGLAKLAGALSSAVAVDGDPVDALPGALAGLEALVGGDGSARSRTAGCAIELFGALRSADGDLAKVEAFVDSSLEPSAEAIAASIKSAGAVTGTIRGIDFDILAAALTKPEGDRVRSDLAKLLDSEELAGAFAPQMDAIYKHARDLVVGGTSLPTGPPAGDPVIPATSPDETAITAAGPVDVATPTTTGVGPAAVGALISERGLARAQTIARLRQLREDLEGGKYPGDRFDIEVTIHDGPGDGSDERSDDGSGSTGPDGGDA